MNILLLGTHLNPGGITTYLRKLTRGYNRLGHKVYIVTSGGSLSKQFNEFGGELVQGNIRTKSELSWRIYFAAFKLARFVKEKKIDVVHANTRVTQVMGQVIKLLTGITYISTCHGFYKKRLARRLFPCWGDGVIAISQAVQDHLHNDFYVPLSKIRIIHTGIEVARFPAVNDNLRLEQKKKYNFGKGPVIGVIARLNEEKGHQFLVRAMSEVIKVFPKAKLVIVGDGREKARLKNLVQELKLESNVEFMSVVSSTVSILLAFDIFVLPSLSEGFGISLMEAQVTGLPVIASCVGGIPDFVKQGETGILVPPGDSPSLAEAIIDLLKNPQKAAALGVQARHAIKNYFTLDKMVADNIDF